MHRSHIPLLVLAIALGASNGAMAELTYFTVDGDTHTIHTGGPGGQCVVETVPGVTTVSCSDGDDSATANSTSGCTQSQGRAFCAIGVWDYSVGPAAVLNCTNGSKFNVSAGTESQTCTESEAGGGSVTCTSPEGDGSTNQFNSSTASCNDGCGNTANAGCCCNLQSDPECKVGTTCR